jgi:hypothetical protein
MIKKVAESDTNSATGMGLPGTARRQVRAVDQSSLSVQFGHQIDHTSAIFLFLGETDSYSDK